jgi:Trypsin
MPRKASARAALRRAGSIAATDEMPREIREMLAAAANRPPVEWEPGMEERISRREMGRMRGGDAEPFRPPWVSAQFLPELRRVRAPIFSRLAVEGMSPFRVRPGGAGVERRPPEMRPFVHEALTRTWPWSTIGLVRSNVNGQQVVQGTGALVGRNVVLTASHLVPWGQSSWSMTFHPGFAGSNGPAGQSWVTRARGWPKFQGEDPDGYDLAILRLADPLGDAVGFMGTQSFADWDDYTDRTWLSVGYPGVFFNGTRPAADLGIAIIDIDADDGFELETHYDGTFGGGWSGGPLWGLLGSGGPIGGDPRVIGVRSGLESDGLDPARRVWAAGNALVDLVRFGRANF